MAICIPCVMHVSTFSEIQPDREMLKNIWGMSRRKYSEEQLYLSTHILKIATKERIVAADENVQSVPVKFWATDLILRSRFAVSWV